VLLLLTAIVTYLTRGQMNVGLMNSMESIAPTIELGGIVERTGEAIHYVVPNRGLWTPAKPIGFIGNSHEHLQN